MYKKGRYEIQALGPLAILIVTSVIIMGFGAKVVSDIGSTMDVNSTARDVALNGTSALGTFGEWIPTITLVLVAAIIIAVVAGAFYIGRK